MVKEFQYPSCAGGMIHACRWLPEGQPKAVVQIIHGIAEYGARYDHFARFLASQGILVTVQDHMGHGGSICDETPRAVIQGGWFDMVEDTYQLFRDTHKEYPDVPYFFFGHSMGSFVLRTILAKYPDSGIAGAVICGTGWMGKPIMVGGLAVASAVCKIKGAAHPSPLLKSVMFGGYNSRIENARTENDWLSTDPKVVDTYNADPNCGFMASAGLVRAMLTGLLYIHKPENLAAMDQKLPVYFIAGGEDPVGNYGKGVELAAAEFVKAGMERVDCRIYPGGRHEILNECNKEEVYLDTYEWIKSVLMD